MGVAEQTFIDENGALIAVSDNQRALLSSNPELFFWNECLFKVYPFTVGNVPCQCRVAVIDWDQLNTTASQRSDHFNLTQIDVISSMLTRWTMLEKFRTRKAESSFADDLFNFTESMFKSVHMKAFEFGFIAVDQFDADISA